MTLEYYNMKIKAKKIGNSSVHPSGNSLGVNTEGTQYLFECNLSTLKDGEYILYNNGSTIDFLSPVKVECFNGVENAFEEINRKRCVVRPCFDSIKASMFIIKESNKFYTR